MTDVLVLSENAATLAKQLGAHLASQGSTAEMKALGANISSTASKISTEIQARRTRKVPTKPILPPGETAMSFLVKKQKEIEAVAQKTAETATTKAVESAAATATEAAKKPLMAFKKGIMTRLPNITGGRRRTHRRNRRV